MSRPWLNHYSNCMYFITNKLSEPPSERCILMWIAYTCVRRRRQRWWWYMAMLCFLLLLCCSLNLHYTNFSLFCSKVSNMFHCVEFHQHCKYFKRSSVALQTSMHSELKRDSRFSFINALQLVALSTHKSIVYMATPPNQSSLSTKTLCKAWIHIYQQTNSFSMLCSYILATFLLDSSHIYFNSLFCFCCFVCFSNLRPLRKIHDANYF